MGAKRVPLVLGLLNIFTEHSFALTPFPRSETSFQTTKQINTENQIPCDLGCFKSNISDATTIDFVCGSDGFTYLNFGELDCVRKNCKRDIYLKQYGRCPRLQEEQTVGQSDIGVPPVPDNSLLRFLSQISGDGQLQTTSMPQERLVFPRPYLPGQYIKTADDPLKRPQQNGNKLLLLSSDGNNARKSKKLICIPDECDCSGEELRPICGSDSVTYGNQCLMDCNKECHPDVIKYHDGHCGKLFLKGGCIPNECGCPEELRSVCGSDSVTYGNRCLLECSKNCNSDIKYVNEGYCGRLFFPKPPVGA